jgi:hypothetical protein
MSFISNLFTAGLVDALWSEIWKFGLGAGLIILSLAAAYFSPIGKQFFLAVAAATFVGVLIYGNGIRTEKNVCAVQKVQFLKQLHKDYTFIPKRKPSVFPWPF